MTRIAPAERVRAEIARTAGAAVAAQMPAGYQRLGRVLVVRLPEVLRPQFNAIGEAWKRELGVTTVLRPSQAQGEFRIPAMESLATGPTETDVVEHGIRYRLDAARLLFSAGNRTERARAGRLTRPGETVVDLFAGIGYFALPAAVNGRAGRVYAVEKNPTSFRYLEENIALNRVVGKVVPILGDNREAAVPVGQADRIFLGYLPSSLPWLARGLELLRPGGGSLHLHLVVGSREGTAGAEGAVRDALARLKVQPSGLRAREVKPYGPGRTHVVVDASLGARTEGIDQAA